MKFLKFIGLFLCEAFMAACGLFMMAALCSPVIVVVIVIASLIHSFMMQGYMQ